MAKQPKQPRWEFHSPVNSFVGAGSEALARAYLMHLNRNRAINLYSLRQMPTRSTGPALNLAKLIEDHVTKHKANLAETRRLLHHGNEQ